MNDTVIRSSSNHPCHNPSVMRTNRRQKRRNTLVGNHHTLYLPVYTPCLPTPQQQIDRSGSPTKHNVVVHTRHTTSINVGLPLPTPTTHRKRQFGA
jgi:hypothetical protein